MAFLAFKFYKIWFRLALYPALCWGSLRHFPNLLVSWEGRYPLSIPHLLHALDVSAQCLGHLDLMPPSPSSIICIYMITSFCSRMRLLGVWRMSLHLGDQTCKHKVCSTIKTTEYSPYGWSKGTYHKSKMSNGIQFEKSWNHLISETAWLGAWKFAKSKWTDPLVYPLLLEVANLTMKGWPAWVALGAYYTWQKTDLSIYSINQA